jgi:transporter family protein
MEPWILFAIISMLFAGITSVIAKQGLSGISSELGLAVRTCFVFMFVLAFAFFAVPRAQFNTITAKNFVWLGLSGVTTTMSWIFYYKALNLGEVSTIALIDKASFVVAVLLAWTFLGEQITSRIAIGGALILTGLVVVSSK